MDGALMEVLGVSRVWSGGLLMKFQFQKVNDELLQKLNAKLLSVTEEANTAEDKEYQDPTVKRCLHELKDAVYHAEDLIDEALTGDEAHTRRSKSGKLLSFSKRDKIQTLHIERKMKKMLQRIEDISTDINSLDKKERGYNMKKEKSPLMSTSSIVDESEIFGLNDNKKEIIGVLLHKTGQRLSVIRIVGMGGIGKTALAQIVYNDPQVIDHFELRVWICISDHSDMFSVTKAIFESLTLKHCDLNDLNSLQVRLKQILEGNRFLLVLDDMWNDNYKEWELLRAPFKDAAYGSCVVVTTRSHRVPATNGTVDTYTMQPLSDEHSWNLFATSAFGDKEPRSNKLEDIQKEILSRCSGLPSAIKAIGNILGSKNLDEWQDHLLRPSLSEEMCALSSIKLSYYALPTYLKRCFAYCSIFPRGYKFLKEKLVLLWMAEGLLQLPEEKRRMEEVGDEYFRELVLRSFFLQSSGSTSKYVMPDLWNDTSHFVMHDLLTDLAVSVSGEYCFTLKGNLLSGISARTRHLSLLKSNNTPVIFEAIHNAKFLRTFLPLDHQSCHLDYNELKDLLSKLKFLRVLSLSHYHITKLPKSICKLIHLRYVDLSHTALERLPRSVCTLINLQTLILSNCLSLTELPEDLWKLVNLRHLDINGTDLSQMPKKMSKLENLGTLPYFIVGKESDSTVKELGGLLYLHGALRISMLQNVVSPKDAAEAGLVAKRYLDELVLEWDGDTVDLVNALDLLEQLVPHTNLKQLSIKFYSGKGFPHWLGDFSFSNMVYLRLTKCKKCKELPTLGQLPSLEVLIIEGMTAVKRVGTEFYGKEMPFKSLKTLTFEGMLEWEEWTSFEGGEFPEFPEFPCLRMLRIQNCPKLKGHLPKQAPSLELQISECEQLESRHSLSLTQCAIGAVPTEGKVAKTVKEISEMEGRGGCEEEIGLAKATTSETKGTKLEQTEIIEERPSLFRFSDERSQVPSTQGAIESVLPTITEGTTESPLPLAQYFVDTSLTMTQVSKTQKETTETEESGESEEETGLEIAKTSETEGTKVEQKEVVKEDPSRSLFSDEKFSLPSTQSTMKSSFPTAEDAVDTSFPMTQVSKVVIDAPETQGRGRSEEGTNLEITKASVTEGTKVEQTEANVEDPLPSPFSEGKSSSPSTQNATTASFPTTEGVTVSKAVIDAPETQGRGGSEEGTSLEKKKASVTEGTKVEQKEVNVEDPLPSPFPEGKSSLPSTQNATTASFPTTEGFTVSKAVIDAPETQGRGGSEEGTSLEIKKASVTEGTKVEQKEVNVEDPLPSPFPEGKSSSPSTQNATTASFPTTEGFTVSKAVIDAPETQGRGGSEEGTSLEIKKASVTEGTKVEQKEVNVEDPLPSPFPEGKSSSPSTQNATTASFPTTEGFTVSKAVIDAPETQGRGGSEEGTSLEIKKASVTEGTKVEQKEVNVEDPLPSPFPEGKSSSPSTQNATTASFPTTEGFTVSKAVIDAPETQGRGGSEEGTSLEIKKASVTEGTKVEQKEVNVEDPLPSPFPEGKSSSPSTQNATTASFPTTEGFTVSKAVIDAPETQGRGGSEEGTSLEIKKASVTEGTKVEQKEVNVEDPLPSPFPEGKSSSPSTQNATTASFPTTEGFTEAEESRDSAEDDVLSDTWSNSSFESMKVSEISELMALPTPLHSLKIEGCDDLTSIPESVIKNPSLQHLYIINCCSLESFPLEGMVLKILYIRNCKKLDFPLATENIKLCKLEDLSVGSSCDSLKDLSLHLFPELRSLSIWDCAELQKLSMPQNSQRELTSLEALEIRDCPNLENFPTGGLPTPNLKSIWFSNCKSLKKLPDQLSTLECLKSMFINDCPELETLSEQVLPSKLSLLRINFCNKLIPQTEWGLHGLASLCLLEIEGGCKNVESFPVEGLLPSNLSSLRISKLSDLEKLDNAGLKKLESLKTLEISCCDKLQFLPEDGFPSSLSFLCIKECPLLTPKLHNKNREDWSKIAHISCIEIDEEVIS
ncbi:uncharacterized protein LOC115987288 isoform X3 [Quercus lobata]|uniref:uncharacterized protein LOC115987288 isoform X3 n=1 Tax=Quercus lobata TaxID=97700 RepID=UPI0012493430|nr:uncharacterized protein LOC115987288 isoform X3 [Quercus lobata]